jgi:hypothetical protein
LDGTYTGAVEVQLIYAPDALLREFHEPHEHIVVALDEVGEIAGDMRLNHRTS